MHWKINHWFQEQHSSMIGMSFGFEPNTGPIIVPPPKIFGGNIYSDPTLLSQEWKKIPPKVAPKPRIIFRDIEYLTHDNPAHMDDLYPDNQECFKDQIRLKNRFSDSVTVNNEWKPQLYFGEDLQQVSDSCRSSSSGV